MRMTVEALESTREDDKINWITTAFMIAFHLEGPDCLARALVDRRKPGNWHGLSSPAYPSRVQDSEVGGVFPDCLRHPGAGRRTDLLGSNAPHSSSVLR